MTKTTETLEGVLRLCSGYVTGISQIVSLIEETIELYVAVDMKLPHNTYLYPTHKHFLYMFRNSLRQLKILHWVENFGADCVGPNLQETEGFDRFIMSESHDFLLTPIYG